MKCIFWILVTCNIRAMPHSAQLLSSGLTCAIPRSFIIIIIIINLFYYSSKSSRPRRLSTLACWLSTLATSTTEWTVLGELKLRSHNPSQNGQARQEGYLRLHTCTGMSKYNHYIYKITISINSTAGSLPHQYKAKPSDLILRMQACSSSQNQTKTLILTCYT